MRPGLRLEVPVDSRSIRPAAAPATALRPLVDVPVSDLEVGLLRKGMPADVILEGETQMRQGTVLLTRGAASVLGSADLAAIAKGHGDDRGQVIVSLDHTAEDAQNCPIGVAAWVDSLRSISSKSCARVSGCEGDSSFLPPAAPRHLPSRDAPSAGAGERSPRARPLQHAAAWRTPLRFCGGSAMALIGSRVRGVLTASEPLRRLDTVGGGQDNGADQSSRSVRARTI